MGTVDQVVIAAAHGASAMAFGKPSITPRWPPQRGKQTHTLGQVVPQRGRHRGLMAQGIRTVDSLDQVDAGAAVVIALMA
jgi:hypothetical protein